MNRLNWASAGPAVTAAEANASRNGLIAQIEAWNLPALDLNGERVGLLALLATNEARRIAAIEGQK